MSAVVSALSSSTHPATAASNSTRHTADFHRTIWGNHFLAYASDNMEVEVGKMKQQREMIREDVRMKFLSTMKDHNLSHKLNFIDSVQRLGVSYHFESEIDEALKQIYNSCTKNNIITHDDDLYSLGLLFRLLRQQGYRISSSVFNKFKDETGNFSARLQNDVQGLLSLYEAAQYRVKEEKILEEALDFTQNHLVRSLKNQQSPSLAPQVKHSLNRPLHKGMPRLEARYYMSFYEEDPAHDKVLLTFAKLDFNILQKLHQKELSSVTKWWNNDLVIPGKLSFIRDRIVEGYFWVLGVYYEPHYCVARSIMMKVFGLSSIIDDIYDAYGTFEELELFTEAVERWDMNCLDDLPLPEYMKVCYKTLLDVYDEIEQTMRKEGRIYGVKYAKEEMKRWVQAQMTEARWFHKNHVPTMEEYLQLGAETCGYRMLSTSSYLGMGEIATENIFKWVTGDTKMVKASSIICRLMDDIVSNEFEQKRGHIASSLECYMKEYGVSRQDAINELRKLVNHYWQEMNEECLGSSQIPMPFLMRVFNFTRMMDVIYKDQDDYTNAGGEMKNHIKMLLVDALQI